MATDVLMPRLSDSMEEGHRAVAGRRAAVDRAAVPAAPAAQASPAGAKGAVELQQPTRLKQQLSLTLVCDHRILNGADGARLLARVKELLEQPLALVI